MFNQTCVAGQRAQSARSFPPEPASATHVTNGLARVPSPSLTDTSEWAIAEDHLMLKSETAAAGGQTGMSDGCGRLALCAYEEKSPRPGGRCRRAGRVAVYLPGGGRNRLADHDGNDALEGLAAVRRSAVPAASMVDKNLDSVTAT